LRDAAGGGGNVIYRYRNVSNIPDWQDGDVIDMSNLIGVDLPNIAITITNSLVEKKDVYPTKIIFGEGNNFVTPKSNEPDPPPVYPELAANAEIVLNALKGSGKLTPEQIVGLEQLASRAKAISGTDAELGQIATEKTIEMIATLNSLGYTEFANQMQQTLQQIQAGWEV